MILLKNVKRCMKREYKKYYWLNDEARTFLSRGYLKEGVTPEQRIKDIANYAEKILGIRE
jgi:ribonucleoside-diphosphate reductase alpha chain